MELPALSDEWGQAMMGSGAPVPGHSAHDQAMTMLKVAADAKGTKDRLDALDRHTLKYNEAKAAAEKATSEAIKAATALSKREHDLAGREAKIQEREEAHTKDKDDVERRFEARAASLAEREALLRKAQGELAQNITDFSRNREKQLEAIQSKAESVNKLYEALEADRKAMDVDRANLNARIERVGKFLGELVDGAKRL